MSQLITIALYGWPVVAIALFACMPARRAAMVAYIAAWMFLPQAGIEVSGLPDITKVTAPAIGVMLGILLFDPNRLFSFRPSWVDLPLLVWFLAGYASSVTNDLGWYDGLSTVLQDVFTWGVPYLVGRLYFNDLIALRELALGIVIGGLVYVPLCLFEVRFSPQLHKLVYGYHPASFAMAIRLGGYRPMVFMQHGLMVGMWMTSATLCAVWLWRTGAVKALGRLPMSLASWTLAGTTLLCKSSGAIGLLLLGLAALFMNRFTRSGVLLAVIVLITPAYMLARTGGWWSGEQLIDLAMMLDEERAASIMVRLDNEEQLIDKASQKPWFGWGGWGRWRITDEGTGEDLTKSDGMWIITRGERGMVGLVSMTVIVLLPFALLLRRVPAKRWGEPLFAAPVALVMLAVLWSIDNLLNAMFNPVYVLAIGGVAGLYIGFPQQMAALHRWRQQIVALVLHRRARLQQEMQRRMEQAKREREAGRQRHVPHAVDD
jgi:hypothetical protein